MRTAAVTAIIALAVSTASSRVAERPGDLPARAVCVEGYAGRDSICARLAARPLDAVEGLWQFGTPGIEVAIIATTIAGTTSGAYAIVCVHPGRYVIEPGTIIGYIMPAARAGSYDAYLYTRADGNTLTSPERYALLADSDGLLSFTEVHSGYTLSPGRLFSRLFVVGLHRVDNTPDDHRGCRRLFPPSSDTPPVYL